MLATTEESDGTSPWRNGCPRVNGAARLLTGEMSKKEVITPPLRAGVGDGVGRAVDVAVVIVRLKFEVRIRLPLEAEIVIG